MKKYIIIGTLGICAVMGYFQCANKTSKYSEQTIQSVTDYDKKIEDILNEPFFQKFQDFIESAEYDPFLEKKQAYMKELMQSDNSSQQEAAKNTLESTIKAVESGGKYFAATLPNGLEYFKRKKSRMYFTKACTEFPFQNIDDLRSVIHHECLHTIINYNGFNFSQEQSLLLQSKLKMSEPGLPDEVISDWKLVEAMMEVEVYDRQLAKIMDGTFKVSPVMKAIHEDSYKSFLNTLLLYEKEGGVKGMFANAALKSCVLVPSRR